jgi:GntR family transcriptional regulator
MLRTHQRVVPLYYQVQHILTGRIRSGEYPPGSQLPSESELGRMLLVSRVTVREALRVLTDEKLVVKSQGKGTFVADPLPQLPGERRFTGYLEDLYDQLPRVTVRHIEISHVPVTDEIRRALDLPATESTVVRIKRARFVNGAPYAFTVNVLPLAVGGRLEAALLRRMPIVRILEDVLQIGISGASEVFQAAAADTEIAHWLEVPVLSPVMHVRRLLLGAARRPLQIVNSYYRSDKFHYSVQLVRVRDNGRASWSETGKKDAVGQVLKI